MATSPTQRTLAECRKRGWIAQVVEKWIPQARKRVDLFGCIDVVAIVIEGKCAMPQHILGIQTTSGSCHAARMTKAMNTEAIYAWIEAGGKFEVWSWRLGGPKGKRKKWTLRVEELTLLRD